MAKKILVPLEKGDRVEDFIPYIKEITRPGMSVVFLIHHPVNGFRWLQAYSGVMEGVDSAMMIWRMAESYCVETRTRLAKQGVFHTCEALHQLGVKIAVEVYMGGLRRALRSYINSEDVDLIVARPGIGLQFMSWLHRTAAVLSIFRRSSSPSLGPQAYSESTLRLLRPGT